MRAGTSSCSCPSCGAVCTGRFEGCSVVWASPPRLVRWRPLAPPARAAIAPAVMTAAEPDDLRTAVEVIWSELQAVARALARQHSLIGAVGDELAAEVRALRGRLEQVAAQQERLREQLAALGPPPPRGRRWFGRAER